MHVSVLKRSGLRLSQGAAVLLLAGISAGCSSQVARFGGVDDFMTASTPNQREIIRPSAQTSGGMQPYPGDTQQVAAAPADGSYSGSVTRGALAPVSTAPAAQPVQTASLPAAQPVDDMTTGAATPQPAIAEEGDIKGWSRAKKEALIAGDWSGVALLARRRHPHPSRRPPSAGSSG